MDAPLLVRPMQSLAEHRALARNPTWRCYSRTVPLHHVLVAVGSADHIVGYAAVEPVLGQPRALVIAAVKSRQPGAGRALLDTLKA